jgi:flagellar hook-associated protein 2
VALPLTAAFKKIWHELCYYCSRGHAMVNSVTSTTSSNNTSNNSSTTTNLAAIGSSIVTSMTGSTVDIQSLADQLTIASKAPRQALLDARKQAADAKISSIGKIQAAANDFQTNLTGLGDPKALAYSANSSDTTVADFAFQSYIAPKQVDFSFWVKQLATANSVSLPQFNSKSALVGSDGADAGTFSITAADGSVVDAITLSSTDTLITLAKKINANGIANGTGLKATILNGAPASDGGTMQTLQITRGTGASNNFTVAVSYTESSVDFGTNSTGLNVSTNTALNSSTGKDAIIYSGGYLDPTTNLSVGGTQFTSASNTFSNLISGVNINVHSTSSYDKPVTISTSANVAGLVNALQTVVSGFNSILKTVQDETKFDSDATKRGGLVGESAAKSFISQLRQLTTQSIIGGSGKTVTLAEIGVKTNLDGSLTIDTGTVSTLVQTNPSLLSDALASSVPPANSTNRSAYLGAIDRMKNLSKVITDSGANFDQLLKRTKGPVETAIATDQTKLDSEMASLKNRYLMQFQTMQNLLNSTKAAQSSLTNMMSSWTAGLKG